TADGIGTDAASLLDDRRQPIMRSVSAYTGSRLYVVKAVIDTLVARLRTLGLRAAPTKEVDATIGITAMISTLVHNFLKFGTFLPAWGRPPPPHDLGQPFERQARREISTLPGHVSRHAKGVHDRLLRTFDDGLVVGAEHRVEERLELVGHASRLPRDLVGGGKSDDNLAGAVRGVAAAAADAERSPFAEPADLVRKGRRGGRDHADDRAVAVCALRDLTKLRLEQPADRHAVHPEVPADAEVGEDEDADRVLFAAVLILDDPRRRADARL